MGSKGAEELVHQSYASKPTYAETMVGVPEEYRQIRTLRDLLEVNYKHLSVDRQLRGNLITKLKRDEFPYRGIIGYDDEVIPAVNRAILAGHDILLIGQIGQAKTKIAETIAQTLLSHIPVIEGSTTNDIPTSIPEDKLISLLNDVEVIHTTPEFIVSKESEESIRNNKLDTKIKWLEGFHRYRYILATPDISVKDLVGQIDAMKIAKKGVELYDIQSYTSGQLLQARHGILCIDELPVLDPRKQVALLSVLQEGKFTTGSYPVVFKPDVKIMATANPIDYTHSGKVIEPLFDRLRSHISTHYPKGSLDEMLIILQETKIADDVNVFIPVFILKTIAKIAELARAHRDISREKGVSVRVGIHSMELLISETERTRSIFHLTTTVPRFCDIHSIHQSVKFELTEIEDNRDNRMNVLKSIINDALKEVSLQYIGRLTNEQLSALKNEFANGKTFSVSQTMPSHSEHNSTDYQSQLEAFPELKKVVSGMSLCIGKEQIEFAKFAKKFGIKNDTVLVRKDAEAEFAAAVLEVALEGLTWVDPPILKRKQNDYGVT